MSRTLDNLKYVQVESSVLSQSQFKYFHWKLIRNTKMKVNEKTEITT